MQEKLPEPLQATMARLSLVRVAKDVFTSDWYEQSSAILFEGEDLETLHAIAEESRREREAILRLMTEWARRDHRDAEAAARALGAAARRDFLDALIDVKEAAAEVLQRAALAAPRGLREEFLRLAVEDGKHALLLRDLVVKDGRAAGVGAAFLAPRDDEPRR